MPCSACGKGRRTAPRRFDIPVKKVTSKPKKKVVKKVVKKVAKPTRPVSKTAAPNPRYVIGATKRVLTRKTQSRLKNH